MAWTVVGGCPQCKRPMWSDGVIDDKTGAPRVKLSCDCERVKKDKVLSPIVIPERDKDLAVRDCERSGREGGEGHVVNPMRFPLEEPLDPTKRDMVFERVQCLKCESHIVLQLVHNTRPPAGVTILAVPEAA